MRSFLAEQPLQDFDRAVTLRVRALCEMRVTGSDVAAAGVAHDRLLEYIQHRIQDTRETDPFAGVCSYFPCISYLGSWISFCISLLISSTLINNISSPLTTGYAVAARPAQ